MSCSKLNVIQSQDLLNVQKPAQYLGGELNSIVKDLNSISFRMALSFPDTYEVGMSHVGIQILYDLINRNPRVWAERAYMPFPDMEKILRQKKISLYSLESKTPLAEFDAIGFSLQYELCGTNILAMLDLSHIPHYATERTDNHPLIIGGGPYSYHPESLAPFFDVFFLGDAEEFIPELNEIALSIPRNFKTNRLCKKSFLEALAKVEGIYIPKQFCPQYKMTDQGHYKLESIQPIDNLKPLIRRRLLPSLENAPFPKKPIVPTTGVVHNRLSLEVMRGCVRGCRFCQAGYLYRPQRERSPQEILDLVEEILPNTGFEEVSLLSLSTADYCSIVPLLKTMMDRYGEGETLAVSFPSTRVDALTPEVLEQVQRVRRTNFTIAPEGGSQRLRDVINKGVTDDQILETCSNVFNMGWSGIKLYFMIGLPTETDEDLQAIVDLAKRIKALPNGRNKDITVSVSTHVPKPHTPFQWAAQITPEETLRKHRILAGGLKRVGVNFRYHDYFSTFLEGVLCRAGRELAPTLVRAYELGARLDAWQDHLNQEIWLQAFSDTKIDPYHYLRERDEEEILPWEHLSCDIPKSYFLKEYKRALRDKVTPDCLKTSCSICGACNYDTRKNILWPREETEKQLSIKISPSITTSEEDNSAKFYNEAFKPAIQRLRCKYSKSENLRYLGHLELSSVIHRALRRANIPVCYSLGFHPLPRVAYGPPLSLGISSMAEYFDVFLYEKISSENFKYYLNETLPLGMQLLDVDSLDLKNDSLQQEIVGVTYQATFLSKPKGLYQTSLPSTEDVLDLEVKRKAKSKKGLRKNKSKERHFKLADYLEDLIIKEDGIEFKLLVSQSSASPTPLEIVSIISGLTIGEMEIIKLSTHFTDKILNEVVSKSKEETSIESTHI